MTLEIGLAVASGLASGLGVWFWAQHHDHPDMVPRSEISLLRSLVESQHAAVLRELGQLRDDLSRSSRR